MPVSELVNIWDLCIGDRVIEHAAGRRGRDVIGWVVDTRRDRAGRSVRIMCEDWTHRWMGPGTMRRLGFTVQESSDDAPRRARGDGQDLEDLQSMLETRGFPTSELWWCE